MRYGFDMQPPSHFSILIEDAFGSSARYDYAGNVLTRLSDGTTRDKSTPSESHWQGFWRFCDLIDLWNWRSHYEPESVLVRDGYHWSLVIARDGQRVSSQGHQAFPALESPAKSSPTWDRFGMLLSFVDNALLVTHRHRHWDFCSQDGSADE